MSTALTGMVFNARRGRLKKTNQITAYHSGDDGDYEKGLLQQYDVLTVGAYSLTKNIEVAHYAAATLTFAAADDSITDSAAELVTFLDADKIVIKGSASNDGVYTVSVGTGATAGHFHVDEPLADEAAGAVVSLYKRTAHSNNCVRDLRTGLMWSRYTSTAEKVGELSTGVLIWADVTKVYTIYSSANTISMILPNIFRITGGAALTQFHVGDLIDLAGFATAANNLPGFYVTAVTPNVGDLDIVIDPINQVLVAEGAVGDSIGLVTQSIFNYAAGANLIGLSGYTDWRNPNDIELLNLRDMEAPVGVPDAVAFPGWPGDVEVWSSTTTPDFTTGAQFIHYDPAALEWTMKSDILLAALVRG